MTSQQLEERSQHLEARVAALETELAQLKQVLSALLQKPTPWWSKIAGSFENDQATPLPSQPSPLEQTTFHQALKASGLVKSVRPPAVTPNTTFSLFLSKAKPYPKPFWMSGAKWLFIF